MAKLKILFVTQELAPYHGESAMANIVSELPQKLQDQGHEVRVFMPRFGLIKERKHRLHEVIRLSGINVPVGTDDNPLIIKVASLPAAKKQIYFLDNEDFFNKRNEFFAENGTFYPDNDERTIFFNKGIIEIILKLGWIPDIVHCHGWMAALLPLYIRTVQKHEAVFKNTRIIYSVYNNEINENFGDGFLTKATVASQDPEVFAPLANATVNDLYMTGLTFADGIARNSPEIAEDIEQRLPLLEKPVMPYLSLESENFVEANYEFYQSLLEDAVLQKD